MRQRAHHRDVIGQAAFGGQHGLAQGVKRAGADIAEHHAQRAQHQAARPCAVIGMGVAGASWPAAGRRSPRRATSSARRAGQRIRRQIRLRLVGGHGLLRLCMKRECGPLILVRWQGHPDPAASEGRDHRPVRAPAQRGARQDGAERSPVWSPNQFRSSGGLIRLVQRHSALTGWARLWAGLRSRDDLGAGDAVAGTGGGTGASLGPMKPFTGKLSRPSRRS